MPRPRLMFNSVFYLMKNLRLPTELFSLSHRAVFCIRGSFLNLAQTPQSENNVIITTAAAGKFRFSKQYLSISENQIVLPVNIWLL